MKNISELLGAKSGIIVMSNGCGSKKSSGAKDSGNCGTNGNCKHNCWY